MYGMPLAQALVFLGAVVIILAATTWRPIHPFVVLVIVAAVFGYIVGYPTSQLGSNFGSGFSEKIYSPGLVIIAASFVAGLAESAIASCRLSAKRHGSIGVTLVGLCAGLGASPASAFAILLPLLPSPTGQDKANTQRTTLTLALSISASHGLLVTPVGIAAVAILAADWHRVALYGLPLVALLIAVGALFVRMSAPRAAASAPWPPEQATEKQVIGSPVVPILAVAAPLLLLIVQSLGDMPSEPLGGGPTRELILGVGRPIILFLTGIGIMIVGQPWRALALATDPDWGARMLRRVASVALIVCAAGGLQRLCQQTGMAEMIGEHLLSPRLAPFGVLIPFLIAAAMKTLQGSSLVAAITAAGMVQPILASLGLDAADGRALAALAVGAGAMTMSHINDDYFWLVTQSAGFSPLRGFATLSLGTLLQGFVAAAMLLTIAGAVSRV